MKGAKTAYFSSDVGLALVMTYDLVDDDECPLVMKQQASLIIETADPVLDRQETYHKARFIIGAFHALPEDEVDQEVRGLASKLYLHKCMQGKKYGSQLRERATEGPAVCSEDSQRPESIPGTDMYQPEHSGIPGGIPGTDTYQPEAVNFTLPKYNPLPGPSGTASKRPKTLDMAALAAAGVPSALDGPSDLPTSPLTSPIDSTHKSPTDSGFGRGSAGLSQNPSNVELIEVSAGKRASNEEAVDRDLGIRLREADRRIAGLDGVNESHQMTELPQPSEDVREAVEGRGRNREKRNKSKGRCLCHSRCICH